VNRKGSKPDLEVVCVCAVGTFVKSLLGKLCGKDGIVIFADGPLGHHLDPKGSWHPTLKAYQGFTIVRDTLPRFVSAYHEEVCNR